MTEHNSNYKWYILALVVLTNMFIMAIPAMGMSVLAKEIADDLGLDLVQVGIIWGAGGLLGIVTGLLAGMLGDTVGPRRVLVGGTLLGGLLSMARGWAGSFAALTAITILLGAVMPFVLINGIKALGQWFPSRQLGLAYGVQAMGMAMGFMIGSLFSATVFSPWLGGWRNVLIAYGLIAALFSIPWFFSRTGAGAGRAAGAHSIGGALRHVAGLPNVWLLGLGLLCIGGAVQGTLGFLPLYLRGVGWQPAHADGALSAFHVVSMALVVPIALWSDRVGARKPFLLAAGLMIACGFGLLSFVSGAFVWLAVMLAGSVRDTFMAIYQTMVVETDRVGPLYAGTAIGFAMGLGGIGNVLAPPLGNSLAAWWPGAPFAFWSALSLFGILCLALVKEGSRGLDRAGVAVSSVQPEIGD